MERELCLTRLQVEKDKQNVTCLDEWCLYGMTDVAPYDVVNVKYDTNVSEKTQRYYEFFLDILTEYLNGYHNVNHSKRYWRILLGTWLNHFVDFTYDRYCHIKKAMKMKQNDVYSVKILNPNDYVTPFDTSSFRELLFSDYFVYQITSDMIKLFPVNTIEEETRGRKISLFYKMALNSLQTQYSKRVEAYRLCHKGHICIIKSFQHLFLQSEEDESYAFEEIVVDYPDYYKAKVINNSLERQELVNSSNDVDEYINIVIKFIVSYIPCIYMENYCETTQIVRNVIDDKVDYFINEDWHFNEFLKFVAAQTECMNGKIISLNPGGLCDVTRFGREEKHEKCLANYYWSREQGRHNCWRIPVERKKSINEKKNSLLFLSAGFYRPYTCSFDDFPVTYEEIEIYFSSQIEFLETLSIEHKEMLTYRFHPYRHSKEDLLRMERFDIKKSFSGPIENCIDEAELVIVDHITTAWFVMLQYNKKYILFWEKQLYPVTDEFDEILNDMRAQGLFFDNGRAAAIYLNNIDNLDAWWEEEHRREARKRFSSYMVKLKDKRPLINDFIENL